MKQFLVVDDSPVIRKIAKRILEGMHFHTAEAEDGQLGLEACSFLMPDCILLDSNMPNVDGYGFLRELRRMPGGAKPKVIFCTTENDLGQIAKAMHAGADEFMMKPFDKQIMQLKLEEIGLS
jgi:two-component system, chemotaxis family, chemotaxis protein CheY